MIEQFSNTLDPFRQQLKLITEAMRGTPVVEWALGVVGVVAALSLTLMLVSNPAAAGLGFLVMVFFMVLLRIVAQGFSGPGDTLKGPALVIIWTVALSFCGVCCLIFSLVVLEKPKTLPAFIADLAGRGPQPSAKQDEDEGSHQRFNGTVRELVFSAGQQITPGQLPAAMVQPSAAMVQP